MDDTILPFFKPLSPKYYVNYVNGAKHIVFLYVFNCVSTRRLRKSDGNYTYFELIFDQGQNYSLDFFRPIGCKL